MNTESNIACAHPVAQVPPGNARSIWRHRDFVVLFSGQIVSYAGDQAQNFAMPLVVLALTGSTTQAGIVLGLHTIAYLLCGFLAGAIADRWDRKRIMIGCEIGRTIITGLIAVGVWTNHLSLPGLSVAAVLTGVLATLFSAANTAALANVVPAGQLLTALSHSASATNTVRIFGATFAGILYGLGRAVPFVVNAVSYIVSAITLGSVRRRFQQSDPKLESGARPGVLADIRDGLRWLWGQPVLRFLALTESADMLRYGAGYLVIIVLAQHVGASSTQIGLIFTGAAIGATVGSLLAARVAGRYRLGHIAVVMAWVHAAVFPLYAIAPTPLLLGIVAAAESVMAPIYQVAITTYQMRLTPDAYRGRTSSAISTLTTGATSIGTIGGGALIAAIGVKHVVALSTGWLLILAIATTTRRSIRQAGPA